MFQSGAQNSEALKDSLAKLYSHKLYNYNALHTGEKNGKLENPNYQQLCMQWKWGNCYVTQNFFNFSYCFPDHPHDHKNKMFEIESVERFGFSGL